MSVPERTVWVFFFNPDEWLPNDWKYPVKLNQEDMCTYSDNNSHIHYKQLPVYFSTLDLKAIENLE